MHAFSAIVLRSVSSYVGSDGSQCKYCQNSIYNAENECVNGSCGKSALVMVLYPRVVNANPDIIMSDN